MNSFLTNFFYLDSYESRTERDRAHLTLSITMVLAILYTIYSLALPIPSTGRSMFASFGASTGFATVNLLGFYGGLIITLVTLRIRRLPIALFGPAIMWYFGAVIDNAFVSLWTRPLDAVEGVGMILLGTLLAEQRGLRWSTVAVLATILPGFAARTEIPTAQSLTDMSILLLQLGGMAIIISLFLRSQRVSREEGAEIAGKESRLAQITTEIAGRISHRTDLNSVLNTTVELINDGYANVYHVQVFLLDADRRNAQLVASTGAVGKLLMNRGHSLPVGSLSVIGQVVLRGEPIVARSSSSQTVHRRNEFLPETRAEAAFPLRLGDSVIGALDLQSKQDDAFEASDLPIFQSLADSIAIAGGQHRYFD